MSEELQGADTGAEATEGMTEEQKDMYELVTGKNPDGTPLKKAYSKDEMLKLAQKGFGADTTFQEAQTTKAQMKEFARMLADPEAVWELVKRFGHDPDMLASGRTAKQMIEAMKSPEERTAEQDRKDAAEWRKSQAEKLRSEEESQIETRAVEIRTNLYANIEETLNTAGVPKTKESIAEVARYIKQQKEATERAGKEFRLDQVKLPNIVAHIKKQNSTRFESLFSELDDDGILSMLPEALQRKIGAALTKKMTGASSSNGSTVRKATTDTFKDAPAEKSKNISSDEANRIIKAKVAKMQAVWDRQNGND